MLFSSYRTLRFVEADKEWMRKGDLLLFRPNEGTEIVASFIEADSGGFLRAQVVNIVRQESKAPLSVGNTFLAAQGDFDVPIAIAQ